MYLLNDSILFVIIFFFGVCMGWFLNVCIYRISFKLAINSPELLRGKAIEHEQIFMRHCSVFLLSKSKSFKACLNCILIELLTGVLYSLTYFKYGLFIDTIIICLFLNILIIVSMIDIYHSIIPDSLLVFGFAVAVINMVLGITINLSDGLIGSVLTAMPLIIISIIGYLVFKRQVIGFGDIKLLLLIGMFLGWRLGMLSVLIGVWIAGVYSICLVLLKKKRMREEISLGGFLSLAAIICLFMGGVIFK